MRKWFSARHGFKPMRVDIQMTEIQSDTRKRLWNELYAHYLSDLHADDRGDYQRRDQNTAFLFALYHYFYKETIDEIDDYRPKEYELMKDRFFQSKWYEVYDFLEVVIAYHPKEQARKAFTEGCNGVLEEELCGWRIVADVVAPITSEQEIKTVEEATTCPAKPSADLIRKALRLLSDKKAPDYPNSIKDSVSAVEALCKIVAGDAHKTFSQCLPAVKQRLDLHGAMLSSLDNLYGYRGAKSGVAHGGTESPTEGFEEAYFFLVVCSAWLNYLTVKAQKKGVALKI